MKKQLNFVTTNNRKYEEMCHLLKDFDLNQIEPVFNEIQGNAEEIIIDKINKAYNQLKQPVFVDDVSLIFKALGELPGVYVNDFLINLGYNNLEKLLWGFENKSAIARCYIGYMAPDLSEPIMFVGEVQGKIVKSRGKMEFGWDSIFEPLGFNQTFAEMGIVKKANVSHRKKALDKFLAYLKSKN